METADDFNWITSEVSATPLLDVQAAPGLKYFAGVQSTTIVDFNSADTLEPHYMENYPSLRPAKGCPGRDCQSASGLVGITSLNCSGESSGYCRLSGLTIISASGYEGAGEHVPAVRVWDGTVDSVTVLSSQITGASDVLNAENIPVGSWVSRSGGGFTFVGTANDSAVGNAKLTATGGSSHHGDWVPGFPAPGFHPNDTAGTTAGHGVLLGESGEAYSRMAIETSGAIRWGDGASDSFHTTLRRVKSNATQYDLPPLPVGGVVSVRVDVARAMSTDVVTASYSSLAFELIFVSVRVAKEGVALVLFRNEDEKAVDVPSGTLRVVASTFGAAAKTDDDARSAPPPPQHSHSHSRQRALDLDIFGP